MALICDRWTLIAYNALKGWTYLQVYHWVYEIMKLTHLIYWCFAKSCNKIKQATHSSFNKFNNILVNSTTCICKGRLKITTEFGKNATTGKYDKLYSFGGRSFSIRRADTMELVYDSKDELEHKTALLHPSLFNSAYRPGDKVSNSLDKSSDNKVIK